METKDATNMARDYLDESPGLCADIGFEIIDVSRFDFKEWEIECRIWSKTFLKMGEYVVVIHDDEVLCAR